MSDRETQTGPIIVFDGDCNICSRWVRFLMVRDTSAPYRFAAMQGAAGQRLLSQYGLDPDDPETFILVTETGILQQSDAIAAVLKSLGEPWSFVGAMIVLIPQSVRDWAYRRLARNRYRWFGKRDVCYAPSVDQRWRFLA